MADEPGNGHAQQHAHHAARAGQHHGLDEELGDDIAAFGSERAADTDLARALGHAGEHDVHNADAADEQRNGGYRAEHDVENLLGPFGPLEQFQRDEDVVVFLFVVPFHDFFDGIGHRGDLLRSGHLDGDFVELDPFLFKTAAPYLAEDFAVTGLGCFERDEHPVGGGLDVFLGLIRPGAFAARLHHSDDFVVVAPNADILAQG